MDNFATLHLQLQLHQCVCIIYIYIYIYILHYVYYLYMHNPKTHKQEKLERKFPLTACVWHIHINIKSCITKHFVATRDENS